jgi:hypothetical protein
MFPVIVFDLDLNGFHYHSVESSVLFFSEKKSDKQVRIGSFGPFDGFLFIDLDGNGCATLPDEIQMSDNEGSDTDFLKIFDTDDNYLINKDDLFYSKLSLWFDKNGNQECTIDEVIRFSSMSITLHLEFNQAGKVMHNATFDKSFKFTIAHDGQKDIIGNAVIVSFSEK